MISLVALDGNRKESGVLKKGFSDVAAFLTEEYWETNYFASLEENEAFLKQKPLIDFACYDVTLKGVPELLPDLRKTYEQMGLLLVADETVSPLVYLKPGIRADSLLLRPFSEESIREPLREFVKSGLERNRRKAGEESFVIETKEGKTYVPYDSIWYFESREKKVFVRLLQEEYSFYSTLDELEQQLPERFVRCHRSYIIDKEKIKKVQSGQNLIELTQGFEIPLSRSYKGKIKEMGNHSR